MAQDILSFMPTPLNYIVRILIAAACGFAIGFERKQRSKEAGIRTHAIVALGIKKGEQIKPILSE